MTFTRTRTAPSRRRGASTRRRAQRRPGEIGVPARLHENLEHLSGIDLSDVRVHRGSRVPALYGAEAVAEGSEVHLAPGHERHLPHELWHLVQQRQGRVAPTAGFPGMAINDDPRLESEATRMGDRAARSDLGGFATRPASPTKPAAPTSPAPEGAGGAPQVAQLNGADKDKGKMPPWLLPAIGGYFAWSRSALKNSMHPIQNEMVGHIPIVGKPYALYEKMKHFMKGPASVRALYGAPLAFGLGAYGYKQYKKYKQYKRDDV